MQENKNISSYRLTLRDRILDAAMKAFSSKGIKAVKMDDIAQQLSISKRTLYEIYENKEVLLFEGVRKQHTEREQELRQLLDTLPSVMDVILSLYLRRVEKLKHVTPQFYTDLKRYPAVLEYLEQNREASQARFNEFISRGMAEGYFRSDVDYELVSCLFHALSQYIMSSQLYSKYSMEQIMRNLLFVSLRGFCTQKGIEVLDGFLAPRS